MRNQAGGFTNYLKSHEGEELDAALELDVDQDNPIKRLTGKAHMS